MKNCSLSIPHPLLCTLLSLQSLLLLFPHAGTISLEPFFQTFFLINIIVSFHCCCANTFCRLCPLCRRFFIAFIPSVNMVNPLFLHSSFIHSVALFRIYWRFRLHTYTDKKMDSLCHLPHALHTHICMESIFAFACMGEHTLQCEWV